MQLLDDLDDLFSSVGLAGERIRDLALAACFAGLSLAVQVTGVLLALRHPPLALAAAMFMFTVLLYRAVTTPCRAAIAASDPA